MRSGALGPRRDGSSARPSEPSHLAAQCSASWADLAQEHLSRLSDCLMEPEDFCRLEVACSTWCVALRDGAQALDTWRRLCAVRYPTMAARVAAECAESSDGQRTPSSVSPASTPLLRACASPVSRSPVFGRSRSSPTAAPLPNPASPTFGPLPESAEPLVDGIEANGCLRLQSGLHLPAAELCEWRALFRRRYLRQKAWEAERERSRRGSSSATQEVGEEARRGKDRGQRATRTRACKRCGVDFDPRSADGCRWHSGRFVLMGDDGVVVNDCGGASRDIEKRAQAILKAHNRKKSSRKSNMIVFGAACESGVAREDGLAWRWSCCNQESVVAKGCTSGRHS